MPSSLQNAPLIAFEGIDGSGKGTQAARLHQSLIAEGLQAELLSFPRYQSTFFGARIGEFLNGEMGELHQLDPFLISLLYAGDRFESKELLQQARSTSQCVLLDRYIPSNIAHQSGKRTGAVRQQIQEWIEQVEYGLYQQPRPDLVILLDVPVAVSQDLIRKKSQRTYTDQVTDLQESDVESLTQVREVYLSLAKDDPTWVTVPVVQDGVVRPIDEIASEIRQSVRERLKL